MHNRSSQQTPLFSLSLLPNFHDKSMAAIFLQMMTLFADTTLQYMQSLSIE